MSETPPSSSRSGQPISWVAALAFGIVAAVAIKRPLGAPVSRLPRPADRTGSAAAGPASTSRDQNGRDADTPSEIPARSWIDILKRVYAEIGDDRVLAVAAGVTFYALLAIFPAIVALVSLYGLFADASTITEHLNALSGVLPSGALDIVGEQVKRITSKPGGSLGFGFAFGLATALWSANAGMKALFDALNIVYDEKEERGFIKLNAISLAFTVGAIVFLLVAIGLIVVLPIVFNFIGLGSLTEIIISLVRWPVLLLAVAGVLALVFRYGPSRRKAKWRWITWGSAFSAIGWIVGSMLFSLYVSKFGSYNETYGSLGAVIGFMTWIWLSTTIILMGGEINAEMEHQTAKDTTTGHAKPLGTRDAAMADQVA